MIIDRHNYEECFILYWDNELTALQKQAVENFVKENPDLQTEFNILGDTRFTPDSKLQFEEKDFLLHDSTINITNYQEQLLNYIDDEVSTEERREIERTAEKSPLVQKELLLLQKTKLQPEAGLIFPDKSSLYRREEKPVRVVTMTWFRVAAAAVIILIAGLTVFQLGKTDNVTTPPVAEVNKSKVQPQPQDSLLNPKDQNSTGQTVSEQSVANVNHVVNKKETAPDKNGDVKTTVENKNQNLSLAFNEPENKNNLPKEGTRTIEQPINADIAEVTILEEKDKTGVSTKTPHAVPAVFSESAVTLKDNPSLYIPEPEEKERGGGLKEFLRKTTRVFERRTKIQTTTEDNKLLVGAFAVSLK